MSETFARVDRFCRRFNLRVPILLAPMAGVPAPALSIAVANAGGLGACGVVAMRADEIGPWCAAFRAGSGGAFQLNAWIPDPAPARDAAHEAAVRAFLDAWGPPVPDGAGDAPPPDFEGQCRAMLDARPAVISSIMGVYPKDFVASTKATGIAWFACATTVAEAREAEACGADAIVAQGMEAGGHRGAFDSDRAERQLAGVMSLVPAIVDAVRIPVVATGGIADGRGIAAALALGASAVQIGTGFLRCPESGIPTAWSRALAATAPDETMVSRAFSGRPGRSLANRYVVAAASSGAPRPAAYPIQRAMTAAMRADAVKENDIDRMQAWAGQSAALASDRPAAEVVEKIWHDARQLLA